MKIAITADPAIPVPPKLYGGIERIIDLLIKGLVNQGHEVTLFAHRGSEVPCRLIPYKSEKNDLKGVLLNTATINRTLLTQKFDLIHSFGRLAYILPQMPFSIPKLMSYQREPTISQVKKAMRLAKENTLFFTGCSDYISHQIKPFAKAFTVYNGVDITKYQATDTVIDDTPLVFLGRVEPIKGTHTAIEIALKSNKNLIIAGNVPPEHQVYFNEKVQPFLGEQIQYIGPLNDEQKNELLGKASALLMPIDWNEPFGIVMIEAMACGTPVIGFNKGAIPEVIEDGITGFYGETVEELVKNVDQINLLDRKLIRKITEHRFSAEVIVNQYLDLYKQMIKTR